MAKFASGKYAYAISDRSGFRYRYRDMRREWNGALVGKDEFEAKQPQLGPFHRNEPFVILVGVAPLGKDLIPIKATGQVGNVTVVV